MGPNSPSAEWTEKKVLILGRASPEPSKKYIETVCTGGITETGELLRLYPIPFRYLQDDRKYKLWSWASFEVQKNPKDKRIESYIVRENSIQILAQLKSKAEQFSLLQKAIFPDLEELHRLYKSEWRSLGVVEIEWVGFKARERKTPWEVRKPYTRQFRLFEAVKPLEQTPIELRISFRCKNNPNCKNHESLLFGWEYVQALRNFTRTYGSIENAFEQIALALRDRFADSSKRAFALVGTHSRFPVWMVAQLYWFDRNLPRQLFAD